MKLTIPKEQLQKNISLADGWYGAIFKKIDTKKNTKKPSETNFYAYFELEEDGREMDTYVAKTDDMRGFAPLAMALDPSQQVILATEKDAKGREIKVVQNSLEFDPDLHIGKKLKILLKGEPFEGRVVSKVKDFLPYDANTEVAFM